MNKNPTRRQVIASAALLLASSRLISAQSAPATEPAEPIIDIHQHTNYSGRTDEQLLRHQQAMGVTQTVLLPAGTPVKLPSTHDGKSNGLAAGCGGFDTCLNIAKQHPGAYFFFANEVPDLPTARDEIVRQIKLGALGIGEQKFNVDCDSPAMEGIAQIAAEFKIPVLMHFQDQMYNKNILHMERMLKKFPQVNFIGHAQTFWAYIDKNYTNTRDLYPKAKITPGGYTDRLLSDYPNMWADISAGSGLNSMVRDEDHARGFLERHQDKIMFGSDCNDIAGRGPSCQGWLTIHTVRRLAPSKKIERKILYENAKRMFSL